MSTINFSQLKPLAIFSLVVESGSFAAAARKLNTSRSRVSEQVSGLEEALGIRLIQRSTRQLAVTPEGDRIYQLARTLPEVLNDVEAIGQPAVPSGRVALTVTHDVGIKHLAPVLEGFCQRYPQIQLDLVVSDQPLDLIGEQIDLGIRIGFPKDDSLVARVLHQEAFSLYASPAYLTQHGTPASATDLEQHRWITLFQSGSDGAQHLIHQDNSLTIRPTNFFRTSSPLMMQQMICDGLGMGCLLPVTVKQELADGRLVQVMPEIGSERLVFTLLYPSRRQIPQRVRCLIDYLLEAKLFG
ncbi:LysR family transcriptional regulator [Ferrimonas sp. YFM]|uniref:LysR family transcriptional regulator n=1 Tax=Ferrimonas sp. YFM TaxID=3028878 RepID=UPI00257259A2|nr:LysR family transcriptional regulator [Ferrimonas sp. YFM]BDY06587.1 LysR family transcriptional regulator [Ferrimonas sp. YFM]